MRHDTTLLDFLRDVYLLHRTLKTDSEQTLLRSCRQFSITIPSRSLREITDDDVSRWVYQMQQAGFSPATIRGKRGDVIGVLAYAAELGRRQPLGNIRKVRVPRPTPRAWRLEEFGRIMQACQRLQGHMLDGTPRREYWSALLSVAYDSGLRRKDLIRIRASDIDDNGRLWISMHKTDEPICSLLRPHTIVLVRDLAKRRGDSLFAIPGRHGEEGHRNQLNKWWPKIRKLAEVEDCGAFHQIRRTGASHLERDQPGAAKAYLGHLTPGMERHYIDRRIAGSNPPIPPAWQ